MSGIRRSARAADAAALDCVAFMLVKDQQVLAEKRKPTKRVVPGAIALPGGHVDAGEGPEDALHREIREELGVTPDRIAYVCTLLHQAQELRKLHYFAVEGWQGEIANREADALLWIPLGETSVLDLDVDRTAVAEYVRLYGSGPSGGARRDGVPDPAGA